MTNKYDEAYVWSLGFNPRMNHTKTIQQALKLASKLERGEVSNEMHKSAIKCLATIRDDESQSIQTFKAMAKGMLEEVEKEQ